MMNVTECHIMSMSAEQERKKAEAERESLRYQQHAFVNGMRSDKSEPMFASGLDHEAHGVELE